MTELDEIRIELSQTKIFLLLLLAVGFVVLGLCLVLMDFGVVENSRILHWPTLQQAVGLTAILFFGLCGIYALRKLSDKTPGLVINGQGFTDNSSGVAAGSIAWSEVTAVQQYRLQGQKFISILVEDPEKYLRQGNMLQRMANRANLKMCGTPINISSNSLKMSHTELLALIQGYFRHSLGSGSTEQSEF